MDTRTKEAVRYLGYGRQAIDERTLSLIQESFEELDQIGDAKFVYRIFELVFPKADTVKIENMVIESKRLFANLKSCDQVILFAITLGAEVDRRLRKYEVVNLPKAVVFQAAAAAYLEEQCDRFQEKWDNFNLHSRFSPGYGDFSIEYQKQVLEMLDAPKQIGLTMTESYMLTPIKSVTALIGISKEPVTCPKSGCETCDKRDCPYRRS